MDLGEKLQHNLNQSDQDLIYFTVSCLFLPPWCALAAVPR